MEAIVVPMVYLELLSDAVVNLSPTINKLLLLMFEEDLVSVSGLRQFFYGGILYHEEKVENLYMILPQKGVEGLKGFMEVLQDTGRRIPSHQHHLNLMTSRLQLTCLLLRTVVRNCDSHTCTVALSLSCRTS